MTEAVALTNYMRDYIWSIGVDRMRPAAEEGVHPLVPNQQSPITPPVTPAGEIERRASVRRPELRGASAVAPNKTRR